MKKMIGLLIAILIMVPTFAFSSVNVPSERAVSLEARNQAFSEYLTQHLTWEAASNDELRQSIVDEFFAMHPDYKDVSGVSSRSANLFADSKVEPKEIKQEDLFRQEIQETEYITNTVEFYITYYDDGSFVLGTLTSRRNEDPNSEEVKAAREKAGLSDRGALGAVPMRAA